MISRSAIAQAPSQSDAPLALKVGDVLDGLYITLDGEQSETQIFYLALGMPGNGATSFDDGMTKLEFVLIGCKDNVNCDFSPAQIPE